LARYFFHMLNGRAVLDHAGVDLPSHLDARLHAIAMTSSIMSGLDANWRGEEWTMTVTDAEGAVILTLKFSGNFGTTH
jgi:hypothetical protein